MEHWKNIPDWDDFYEVSDAGRVRSKTRKVNARGGKTAIRRGKVLKPVCKQGRYLAVTLSDNDRRKQHLIHNLVTVTFIGPKPKNTQVCHTNGNKHDNRLVNLRYGTVDENTADRYKNDEIAHGENHGMAKLTEKQVRHILTCKESNLALSLKYDVTEDHVANIRRGRVWKRLHLKIQKED